MRTILPNTWHRLSVFHLHHVFSSPMSSSPAYPIRAVLFALAGFTLWVIGDAFMKLAGDQKAPYYEIMVIGGLGGLVSILSATLLRGNRSVLRPRKIKVLFLLGVMFFLSYFCWLKALAHLSLANFYVFLFLSPTLVAFLASVLLKESLGWQKVIAILAGFVGVVIAVNPTQLFSANQNWGSYAAAIAGTLIVVSQQLILRFMAQHETRESSAFYPRFGPILGGGLIILIYGFDPLTPQAVFYSLMSGATGGIGWVFMAQAYKLAPAASVSPFHYSQIISGALIGYFVWDNIPTVHMLLGASVIILSGLYMVQHSHKAAKIANSPVNVP